MIFRRFFDSAFSPMIRSPRPPLAPIFDTFHAAAAAAAPRQPPCSFFDEDALAVSQIAPG